MTAASRVEMAGEALWELERVFGEPGVFGSMGCQEAAESLASEFTGPWRDDEISSRLEKFAATEASGMLKAARHHLNFAARKMHRRFGVTVLPSQPIDSAGPSEYLAWRAQKPRSPRAQVAHDRRKPSVTTQVPSPLPTTL